MISRCLGVVLVHPVGNASTIMESFKDKFHKWKISNTGENVIAFRDQFYKTFFSVIYGFSYVFKNRLE
jgi:hypothetical protein